MILLYGLARTLIERIAFDETFWHDSLLPKLTGFYSSVAMQYLHENSKPTPATVSDSEALQADMQQYELLLPAALCQSRIGGRNGSLACTVICTYFVEKLLAGLAPDESTLCEAMTNGNLIYDAYGFVGYLSADEVISQVSVFNVHMSDESFVRPSGLAAMVDLLRSSACNTASSLVGEYLF